MLTLNFAKLKVYYNINSLIKPWCLLYLCVKHRPRVETARVWDLPTDLLRDESALLFTLKLIRKSLPEGSKDASWISTFFPLHSGGRFWDLCCCQVWGQSFTDWTLCIWIEAVGPKQDFYLPAASAEQYSSGKLTLCHSRLFFFLFVTMINKVSIWVN